MGNPNPEDANAAVLSVFVTRNAADHDFDIIVDDPNVQSKNAVL